MIALPNLDGSFTVTCFFPFEGENGFDKLDHADDETVLNFFKRDFADAIPLMPNLIHDWRANPTSSLVTVRCFPWSYDGTACLFGKILFILILGDAAHAIVPFFGQGMNAGFEDCNIFSQMLDSMGPQWKQLFQEFQKTRKPDADAIADMALENFIEMRDKVGNADFLFAKQVQHKLGNEFPGRFNSRYELVSFTTIPYSEAARLGKLIDHVTNELVKDADRNIDKVDMNKAKELMDKYFPVAHL